MCFMKTKIVLVPLKYGFMSLTLFILFYICILVMDWLLQTNRRFTLLINPDFRDFDVRDYLTVTFTNNDSPLCSIYVYILQD